MEGFYKKINHYFIGIACVAIITYVVLMLTFANLSCCISWQKVILFSVGTIVFTALFFTFFKYFHQQSLLFLQNEKEKNRIEAERLDYLVRKVVETAKDGQNKPEEKQTFSQQVTDIKTKVEALKGDFNSTFGDLFALSDELKALAKTLDAVLKGDKPVAYPPSPKTEDDKPPK